MLNYYFDGVMPDCAPTSASNLLRWVLVLLLFGCLEQKP